MNDEYNIGSKIRAFRHAHRLSQAQLAGKAGIRPAHLCVIENGKQSITIKTLQKILAALNKDLTSFFSGSDNDREIIYPSGSYTLIPAANDTYRNKLLTPAGGGSRLEVIQTVIQPEGNLGEPHTHKGEEFGLVLQGKGVLLLDGQEFGIREGDRFVFNADRKHTVRNPSSSEELHLLFICTPPAF